MERAYRRMCRTASDPGNRETTTYLTASFETQTAALTTSKMGSYKNRNIQARPLMPDARAQTTRRGPAAGPAAPAATSAPAISCSGVRLVTSAGAPTARPHQPPPSPCSTSFQRTRGKLTTGSRRNTATTVAAVTPAAAARHPRCGRPATTLQPFIAHPELWGRGEGSPPTAMHQSSAYRITARVAERERTAPQAKPPAGRGFGSSAPNYSKQNLNKVSM